MFSLFPNTFAKLGEVKEAGILTLHARLCAKLLQSCPTLCDSVDCSPLGSSVHGDSPDKNPGVGCHALLQGILPNECGCQSHSCESFSVVSNSMTPWTVACQAPLSMEFSRQEYWSGLPRPPPGDLTEWMWTSKSLMWKLLSCVQLYDPMDCSLPGSSVHGILQTRMLEWVAISLYRRSSQPRDWTQISSIAGWFFTIWATREAQVSNPCLLCLLH